MMIKQNKPSLCLAQMTSKEKKKEKKEGEGKELMASHQRS